MDKQLKERVRVCEIIKYIEDNRLRKKQFAEKCGIKLYSLNTVLDNKKDFHISILAKIALTMGVSVDSLINWEIYEDVL